MSQTLQTNIEKLNIHDKTVFLVSLMGEIDSNTLDELHTEIDALFKQDQNIYLLFDFQDLHYINSKFIGYLLNWYMLTQKHNTKTIIAGAKDNILDVLKVQGILTMIPSCLTLDEARLMLL